jgi:hypothetical protein
VVGEQADEVLVDEQEVKALEVDVARVVAFDDDIRDVELAAVAVPREVVEFVPEVGVNDGLLTDVKLFGNAIFIVLFESAKVMLAFVELEENDNTVAFKLDELITLIDEELEGLVVAFRQGAVVETTEELLEKAGGEMKLVEEIVVPFIKMNVDV